MTYLASLSDWLWRRPARDRRANAGSRPARPSLRIDEPALRVPLAVSNDRPAPTPRPVTPRRLAVDPEPVPDELEVRLLAEPPVHARTAPPRPTEVRVAEAAKPVAPAIEEGPRPRQFAPIAGPAAARRRTGPSTEDINTILREAFTPTRPKGEGSHFAGRQRQIERIVAAIEEERAHVVIFGERGTGKTSLANVIGGLAAKSGYIVQRFACSSDVTFEDLFQNLLRGVPGRLAQTPRSASNAGAPPPAPSSLEALLPQGDFGPAELLPVLARVSGRHLILMVDEYDRVQNEDTKNKLAEALKNMSDAGVPVMLVLIGVASDVDDLLGKHPSLRRALVTVPLPLMTRREVSTIIENGEQRLGVPFEPDVRDAILDLAPGLPYYAQLLCLFTARSALRQGSQSISFDDLHYAVERCAEEAETSVKEAYVLAVGRGADVTPIDEEVLFAAARCHCDEFGVFAPNYVAEALALAGKGLPPLSTVQSVLDKFTRKARGAVLVRVPVRGGFNYQFQTQMIRHYVLLRNALATRFA